MKAREYWVVKEALWMNTCHPDDDKTGRIRVIELPPGHIVVSRERLRDAFTKSLGVTDACGWSTGQLIERELFGDVTNNGAKL